MTTFIDLLCGAGGSSRGLADAGWSLRLGVNHWTVAIDTHAANFPDCDHRVADIANYPMRFLPRATLLWASVICTELSPGGGRRRHTDQIALFDGEAPPPDAFERTRVTAWCVVRAAEARLFPAVVIENVTEFVTDWLLFPNFIGAMETLGYAWQLVCVSSAHIGDAENAPAPQWRDRIYLVFRRRGTRKPDLEPRPLAHCFTCGDDVNAIQSWRGPKRQFGPYGLHVGKYGTHYDYRCPNRSCRHALIEPYVRPAADAIDWSDLGTRIRDRSRPLADTTMARIRAGMAKFPYEPSSISVTHGRDGTDRAFAVRTRPLPARTSKQGDALLVPVGGSWNDAPARTDIPMRTRTTRESDALVTYDPNLIVEFRNHATAVPASTPLSTVTAQGTHHALLTRVSPSQQARNTLVIPYRKTAPATALAPLLTLGTHDSAAIAHREPDDHEIHDARFRMLKPREQLNAQAFPADYVVRGTVAEQTAQAGNAVSVNVARWIGERLAAVL